MRVLVSALVLLSAGLSVAQDWTVQTAAFQDYRQAQAQIDELRALGFDAYGEFVMNDGKQYSRVRVGCYRSQDGASYLARDLRGYITAEAVPQPMTEGADSMACLRIDPGFVKPDDWRMVRVGNDVAFEVTVGGVVAFLHHDGDGWRLRPELLAEPAAPPLETTRFRQARVAGVDMVVGRLPDGRDLIVCAGTILWQAGTAAVVERDSTVIACVIDGDGTALGE